VRHQFIADLPFGATRKEASLAIAKLVQVYRQLKVKNCPFCKASAHLLLPTRFMELSMCEPTELFTVSCVARRCGAKISKPTAEEAVAAWNKRGRK
jgi:hypothetical protein